MRCSTIDMRCRLPATATTIREFKFVRLSSTAHPGGNRTRAVLVRQAPYHCARPRAGEREERETSTPRQKRSNFYSSRAALKVQALERKRSYSALLHKFAQRIGSRAKRALLWCTRACTFKSAGIGAETILEGSIELNFNMLFN